jgi:murein DD-endopeptidase MepM/ murein hydrolase activator NlpD
MHWLRARRVLFVLPLVLLWVFGSALPAASVTKQQVDSACATSQAALDDWDAAAERAVEALERYNDVNQELESVSLRVLQLRDRIDEKQTDVADIRERVIGRAVEMYMDGGSQVAEFVLSSSSVDQVLTGQEFLEVVTEEDISSLDHLAALKNDMEKWQEELKEDQVRLADLNQQALDIAALMEEAMNKKEAAYRTLNEDCRKLRAEYDAQLAAAAALAAARANGAAGGVPASVTSGFICPMNAGAIHFINDWGFPRSGGRTHKGTDVFAPMGQPVVAVVGGTVRVYTAGLGGNAVWLTSDNRTGYYFAHLSGWAPGLKTGDYVSKGQVIGYNGNTGNAYGGAPHVHFQIHPGGGSPMNPYFTLKSACG